MIEAARQTVLQKQAQLQQAHVEFSYNEIRASQDGWIILDTFPPYRRGAAFSLTAIAMIMAPVIGPVLVPRRRICIKCCKCRRR
jgi:multidrug resistance efflux pump